MNKNWFLISYLSWRNNEGVKSYEASQEHKEKELKQEEAAEALPGA